LSAAVGFLSTLPSVFLARKFLDRRSIVSLGLKLDRWVFFDLLAGIAKDSSSEELQKMRQLRQELKAEARISKELAGTDSKAQEAEFLEYARNSVASSEFDSLVGLAEKPVAATPAKTAEKGSALPE
jgi:hypothetical protein